MTKNPEQARGRFKQAIGDLSGSRRLKRRGKVEARGGRVKDAAQHTKDRVDRVVDTVTDKILDS